MDINIFEHSNGLFLYVGDAAAHDRDEGLFEVRFFDHSETFPTLGGAYLRYLRCKTAISLWDITLEEVFLESKVFVG